MIRSEPISQFPTIGNARQPVNRSSKRDSSNRSVAKIGPRACRGRRCSAQPPFQPVADEVRSDLTVVGLTVFEAAALTIENLQCLVLRSRRVVELLSDLARSELVLAAPRDEDGTLDLLCHPGQRESLELLHRGFHALHAEHPGKLKMRRRHAVVI